PQQTIQAQNLDFFLFQTNGVGKSGMKGSRHESGRSSTRRGEIRGIIRGIARPGSCPKTFSTAQRFGESNESPATVLRLTHVQGSSSIQITDVI
ncbi:unnamed protein product, partial [Mycena citricolor]